MDNYTDLRVMSKKEYGKTIEQSAVKMLSEPIQQEISVNPYIQPHKNLAVSMIQTLSKQIIKTHPREGKQLLLKQNQNLIK